MSPFEEMIYISQNLEKILQEQYGANGHGLREKAKSVEDRLPEDVFRKICKLAAWRNKAAHENIDLANKKIEAFRRIAWEVCFSLMNNLRVIGMQPVTTNVVDNFYQENSYYPDNQNSYQENSTYPNNQYSYQQSSYYPEKRPSQNNSFWDSPWVIAVVSSFVGFVVYLFVCGILEVLFS